MIKKNKALILSLVVISMLSMGGCKDDITVGGTARDVYEEELSKVETEVIQVETENTEIVSTEVTQIETESVEFESAEVESTIIEESTIVEELFNVNNEDIITPGEWTFGDGDLIVLNEDMTFEWYADEAVKDDNVMKGSYLLNIGHAGVERVATKEDKALTDDIIVDAYHLQTINDFAVLTLLHNEITMDGETKSDFRTSDYVCFKEDGKIIAVNTVTFEDFVFTRK